MRLILYAELVFGMLFVIRTHQIFRARALLSTMLVTKTGTAFVSACLLIAFFAADKVLVCTIVLALNVFCSFISLYLLEKREIGRLQSEFPLFLDRWIMNLRLGTAVVGAREVALRDQSPGFQTLLRPVFDAKNSTSARTKHILLPVLVMRELEKLAAETHSALSRLENLRRLLRKSAEFRRRSGQSLLQTAIQSAVLMVLLIALMLFTLHRYGWKQSGDLILLSGGLALMGAVLMYFLSRKTNWKI